MDAKEKLEIAKKCVEDFFEVKDISIYSREGLLFFYRGIFYLLARNHIKMNKKGKKVPFRKIGSFLNGRDSSTVISAIDRTKELMDIYRKHNRDYQECEKLFLKRTKKE